jgi:hypothetical protein
MNLQDTLAAANLLVFAFRPFTAFLFLFLVAILFPALALVGN